MQEIIVVYLPETEGTEEGKVRWHQLSNQPWHTGPLPADVRFKVWHTGEKIFVHYLVEEKYIRAVHTAANQPVYEDSCVEFFISFDDKKYYNFEFNCLGTCLAGYGGNRNERQLLSNDLVQRIETEVKITRGSGEKIKWSLTVGIPVDVFVGESLETMRSKKCRANFYKCGDLLPEPHFLSWTPIESPEPNFHQPQFFGSLVFQS